MPKTITHTVDWTDETGQSCEVCFAADMMTQLGSFVAFLAERSVACRVVIAEPANEAITRRDDVPLEVQISCHLGFSVRNVPSWTALAILLYEERWGLDVSQIAAIINAHGGTVPGRFGHVTVEIQELRA